MCNFYLMYWADGDEIMSEEYCFTPGPPTWHWSNFKGIGASNAPANASLVPGQKKILASTEDSIERTDKSDFEEILKGLLGGNREYKDPRSGILEEYKSELADADVEPYYGAQAESDPYDGRDEYGYNRDLRSYQDAQQDPYELLREMEEYYENME